MAKGQTTPPTTQTMTNAQLVGQGLNPYIQYEGENTGITREDSQGRAIIY